MANIRNDRGHSYIAGSKTYPPIPDALNLKKVIVVIRHGDRCQISRDLGKLKETNELQAFWNARLPCIGTLREIDAAATLKCQGPIHGTSDLSTFYQGADAKNSPYGMLTELGSEQLVTVGKVLRSRYIGSFIPSPTANPSRHMYNRSTNICRTILSLKSLLHGMFLDTDGKSTIVVPNGTDETMYPQAGGPCLAMIRRRNLIFNDDMFLRVIEGYADIENKIRTLLGFEETKVNWVVVKEILCCQSIHGYPLPEGITEEDIDKITEIAALSWGFIFRDDDLNRLGIGRFCGELLADMENVRDSRGDDSGSPEAYEKMSVYSGHDSTLVPLLCALQIYDDVWPPYASYLTLEIADERAVRPLESASDDSGRSLHHRWVRVLYNDAEMVFPGDKTLTRDGQGAWWPYEHLKQRLRQLSMTHEEYASVISNEFGTNEISLTRDVYEEVRATVTGNSTMDRN